MSSGTKQPTRAFVYHRKEFAGHFNDPFKADKAIDLLTLDKLFQPVATYDPPTAIDTTALLEHVYERTNTINAPWWHNADIVRVSPVGTRSTSVGDVIIIEFDDESEEAYGCAPTGWTPLTFLTA